MTATINASTTAGVVTTADTSGILQLQTNGTAALTVDASQNTTLAGTLTTTGVTTFAAGTAAAPAITTTGDTNTGIFFPAADTIAFATAGTEAMRIDSSGNLTIKDKIQFGTDAQTNIQAGGTSDVDLIVAADTNLRFETGTNERARIDSSGIMLIGATSARTTEAKLELRSAANTALSLYMFKDTQVEATLGFKSSTDSNFYVGSGSTSVGTNGVFLTNTGNSWSSISDERMKTIVEPITNAAEKVSSLRTVIGYFNNDELQTRRPFLIAQDVQAVLPEAVSIQNTEMGTLGMSYTDVIPLLVAAINELKDIVDAQGAEIAALKGATA